MITTITSTGFSTCALTGAQIRPGDSVRFDTVSWRVWLSEPGDLGITPAVRPAPPKARRVPFYQQTFSARRRFA